MKKLFIICLGAMMSVGAMAQQDAQAQQNAPTQQNDQKPQKERLTADQKAEIMADYMTKAYDLTEDQKTKLVDLYKKHLSRKGGNRPQGPMAQDGEAPKAPGEAPQTEGEAPKAPQAQGEAPQAPGQAPKNPGECPEGQCEGPTPGDCPEGMAQCQDSTGKRPFPGRQMRNGFRKELKEILTPEQFKAWATHQAIERQLMGENRGFNRPGMGRPQGPGFRMGQPQGGACMCKAQACDPKNAPAPGDKQKDQKKDKKQKSSKKDKDKK